MSTSGFGGASTMGGFNKTGQNGNADAKNPGRLYKEESSEEYLAKQVIYPIERVHLDRVFEELASADLNKDKRREDDKKKRLE